MIQPAGSRSSTYVQCSLSASQKSASNLIGSSHLFAFSPGGTTKCARTLIQYFSTIAEQLTGKKVVEVGAGTGLVGIAVARLGNNSKTEISKLRVFVWASEPKIETTLA